MSKTMHKWSQKFLFDVMVQPYSNDKYDAAPVKRCNQQMITMHVPLSHNMEKDFLTLKLSKA